jgi:ATP-dependent RNA circularization protein (DNA/RNA ligase family)
MDNSIDKTANESQDQIDEFRHGTLNEKRHTDFVEYLKKMGLKEYENGTVMFYEDETDVVKHNNNETLQSQISI